ncbi:MAG: chemotaxis protein CheW [Actinobacteria bacterium]|nr:chemotaxis protein CheW [Actinomycetota bacterium]
MNEYLLLESRNKYLAMPFEEIKEITHIPLLQDTPYHGKGYIGMLNFRGESLPVYDLAKILFDEDTEISLLTKMMIVGSDSKIGIIFDDLVENVRAEKIFVRDEGVFKEMVVVGERIIPCLNLELIKSLISSDKSTRKPRAIEASKKYYSIFHRRLSQFAKSEEETFSLRCSYLIFRLNKEFCAIEASYVEEILKMQHVAKVPTAPKHIFGIISIRGNIVTVFDIKYSYLGELTSIEEDSKIIVLRLNGKRAALLVDSVVDFVSVENREKHNPTLISSDVAEFIVEQFEFHEELVNVISIEKFFSKIYKEEGVA